MLVTKEQKKRHYYTGKILKITDKNGKSINDKYLSVITDKYYSIKLRDAHYIINATESCQVTSQLRVGDDVKVYSELGRNYIYDRYVKEFEEWCIDE